MAAEADQGVSFGDLSFATPQPTFFNGGVTSISNSHDDDDWGDFFVASSQPQPKPSISNGFSYPSQSTPSPPFNSNPKPSIIFDPFSSIPTRPATDPVPIRTDLASQTAQKPKGALPLSFFGEVEDIDDQHNSNSIDSNDKMHSNGLLDPKLPSQNGKAGVGVVSNESGFDNNGGVFGNLYIQSKEIKPEIGSGLTFAGSSSDLNNLDDGDDEWDFMDAFPGNGTVRQNEEQGASVVPSSTVELEVVVKTQAKQAGQDALSSVERKHGSNSSLPQFVDLFAAHHGAIHKSNEVDVGQKHVSNSSLPQFVDLFAAHHGAIHKSNEVDVGLNNSSTVVNTDGFVPDWFHGMGAIGNGNGISATPINEGDDFDDFGDFVDASQELGAHKEDQCSPDNIVAQLPSEKFQDDETQPENSRGPLPLSLFSDGLEESSDTLTKQDEIFQKPVSNPRNSFNTQVHGMPIHDLLSNLYSQAQQNLSIDDNKSPAENGVLLLPKTEDATTVDDDDDGDDNSWEFKDAFSETGVKELSNFSPGIVPQKSSETMSTLHLCMDFYVKLRESLCILLSHQLNEEKSCHAVGENGNAEAVGHDIQEPCKLLEGYITTEEILSKRHLDRIDCLNEVLEALQGADYKVIESSYSLSERLQLATNDWMVAAELLRHAVSVLHILSLGSADDQSVYVSSWSKIISVCTEELKHGALIWKRALEKNVHNQILSDYQGQQRIQALGEIYQVVELLRLSTKLFKPWVLLSVSDPQQLYGPLEECVSLWMNSGLEEAVRRISEDVGLVSFIKNIENVDVVVAHDCVFIQQRSICRLSLLPHEMLSDLKVVQWNNEPYILILANLWANLIHPDPPQLPHLLMR